LSVQQFLEGFFGDLSAVHAAMSTVLAEKPRDAQYISETLLRPKTGERRKFNKSVVTLAGAARPQSPMSTIYIFTAGG